MIYLVKLNQSYNKPFLTRSVIYKIKVSFDKVINHNLYIIYIFTILTKTKHLQNRHLYIM